MEQDHAEGAEAAEGSAALASFETVSVSTDNAGSLDLPATFDLHADVATAVVYAMSDCGEDAWYGRWELDDPEGGWGDPEWDVDGRANVQAAIDGTTGDGYYTANLFRSWSGGAPLDAYGVEAGDRVGLSLSDESNVDVAEGSGVDPTAPHWTLWGTAYPDELDTNVALASGSLTFR